MNQQLACWAVIKYLSALLAETPTRSALCVQKFLIDRISSASHLADTMALSFALADAYFFGFRPATPLLSDAIHIYCFALYFSLGPIPSSKLEHEKAGLGGARYLEKSPRKLVGSRLEENGEARCVPE